MARHHHGDGAWHEDGYPRLHGCSRAQRSNGPLSLWSTEQSTPPLSSRVWPPPRRPAMSHLLRPGRRLCTTSTPSIYAQGDELDPASIPVLVYVNTAHGAVLSAAMYLMPQGAGTSDPPQPGGCLTQWHVHTDLCIGDGKVVGTEQSRTMRSWKLQQSYATDDARMDDARHRWSLGPGSVSSFGGCGGAERTDAQSAQRHGLIDTADASRIGVCRSYSRKNMPLPWLH